MRKDRQPSQRSRWVELHVAIAAMIGLERLAERRQRVLALGRHDGKLGALDEPPTFALLQLARQDAIADGWAGAAQLREALPPSTFAFRELDAALADAGQGKPVLLPG